MTDFVDRLLGRSSAPPIRPAVASPFEPFALIAPLGPAVAAEPLPSGTVGDPVPDPPETADPTPAEPPGPATAPAPPVPVAAAVQPQPVHLAAAEPPLPTVPAGHPVRTPPRADRPHPPAPAVRVAARPPAGHPPVGIELTGDTGAAAVRQVAAPVEVRLPSARTAPVGPGGGHPVAASVPSAARVPVPPPTRSAARREPSAPDVHISIGRVEVRAATEPVVPPRRERRAEPLLSLDDYLRSRAGGDRR